MAEQASFFGAVWPIVPPPAPPPTVSIPNPPQDETEEARDFFPRARARRDSENAGEIPLAADPEDSGRGPRNDDKGQMAADAAEKRRVYNREYMRRWRERNLERYREYNRSYQRKTALRRKLRSLAAADGETKNTCWYRCGRPATQTIERVDPRTWQTQRVPYCGHC